MNKFHRNVVITSKPEPGKFPNNLLVGNIDNTDLDEETAHLDSGSVDIGVETR